MTSSKLQCVYLPRFLDAHYMKDFDEETLHKVQNSHIDEFGVKHLNILYNSEADKVFCLLDAPSKKLLKSIMSRNMALNANGLWN